MALITGAALLACPICGADRTSCGPHRPTGVPTDDPQYLRQETIMAATEPEELKEYEYDHAGGVYTAMLNAKHAKRLNARPVGSGTGSPTHTQGESTNGATAGPTAKSKARTAENKSE